MYDEKINHPHIYGYALNEQYFPSYLPIYYRPEPSFPTIDPNLFIQSAQQMKNLLADVSTVLNKISSSRSFAVDLMNAAQRSEMEKVKQMIKSTGITHIPKIYYNPTSLKLEFQSLTKQFQCCQLSVNIRWNR